MLIIMRLICGRLVVFFSGVANVHCLLIDIKLIYYLLGKNLDTELNVFKKRAKKTVF